jgi:glycosyltransferase involved in cell wall biosynthesis
MGPSQKTVLIGTSLGDNPVPRHFAALARELTNVGYRAALLVHGPDDDRSYVDPRISILRWPSPRPTGLADALFFDRLLREYRPCCAISNFGSNNLMTMLGALHCVPVRVIWHHTLSDQTLLDSQNGSWTILLQNLRARIVWRWATHLAANSNAMKQDLVEVFGLPTSRCRVFWNCLEDPMPRGGPFAGPENKCHFVCVGRFAHSKGQDVVIRALVAVARHFPKVRVEFIGEGKQRETCTRLADALGVAKHCSFSGRLPHPYVLRQMAAARASLVPSRAEAFGLVCIESMAVGVPVIGSRTGGIAEVVRDRIDGLLFPPGDHAGLARQMIEIINNDQSHSQMRAECRRRFLENFEISRAVVTQARWLDSIIARSDGSGSRSGSYPPGDTTFNPEGGDGPCAFGSSAPIVGVPERELPIKSVAIGAAIVFVTPKSSTHVQSGNWRPA